MKILTDQRPDLAAVDRGYRGHAVEKTRVLISGTRRGLTPKLIADLSHRSAIEPEIGHMETDGRLSRCALKGTIGDALFAVLCGCGQNIRRQPLVLVVRCRTVAKVRIIGLLVRMCFQCSAGKS